MFGLLAAAASSALWGLSDVLGGEGARRIGVLRATTLSYASGTAVLVALLIVTAPPVTVAGLAFGALAGFATMVGFLAFYTAVAVGPMGVAAAGTALLQAIVPVLFAALVLHDRLGPAAWAGLALALPASALLGIDPSGGGPSLRALLATVVAGLGFGVSVVILDAAPVGAGLVPATTEIVLGLVLLAAILCAARLWPSAHRAVGLLDPPRARTASAGRAGRPVALALGGGAALGVANAALIAALHMGRLAPVSVVVSLYPAATAALARLLLSERLDRRRLAGVVLAIAAAGAFALPA